GTYRPAAAENLLHAQRKSAGGGAPAERTPAPARPTRPAAPPARPTGVAPDDELPSAPESGAPVFRMEPVAEQPRARPTTNPRQVPPPRAPARPAPAPAAAPAPRPAPPPRPQPPPPA